MRFTATCLGSDPLGLREKLGALACEQWLQAHVTREDASVIVLFHFTNST
jgi:hypothetical protein